MQHVLVALQYEEASS